MHGKEPVSKVELELAQQTLKTVAMFRIQADKHFGLNDLFLHILKLGEQIVREKVQPATVEAKNIKN